MSESANVEEFRGICKRSSFRHRDEILNRIASEQFSLTSRIEARIPVSSMLDIYSVRLRIGEAKAPKTGHATSILTDIKEYIAGLKSVGGDYVRYWNLTFDEISYFSIFAAVNAQRVIGCIYGIDRRRVTSDEWNELWGEDLG